MAFSFLPCHILSPFSFTLLLIFQQVPPCVCVWGPIEWGGKLLYLAPLTVQRRNPLPPSSEGRSAEEYGKSEAAAYFRKSGEKVGQLTSSLFSLMSQRPLWGLSWYRAKTFLWKFSISIFWYYICKIKFYFQQPVLMNDLRSLFLFKINA